jgi:mono/diheme cytochrome c family protein
MKKGLMVLTFVLLVAFLSLAEEIVPPQDHIDWMKKAGDAMGNLRKGVNVEEQGKIIADTFPHVEKWYAAKHLDTGVKTSKEAAAAGTAIAKAAAAGDKEGISAGMKMVGASCKGCHDVHRLKISDTENKIKW